MHTHIYIYTHTHKHTHTRTNKHTYIYTGTHTYKHTHTNTHTHVQTNTHTYIQAHTHVQTQTHTHTHTHKHAHTIRVRSAEYISSCVDHKACLVAPKHAEFAVIGRSNVGKSSLINMLTGSRRLAKVSKEPGGWEIICEVTRVLCLLTC